MGPSLTEQSCYRAANPPPPLPLQSRPPPSRAHAIAKHRNPSQRNTGPARHLTRDPPFLVGLFALYPVTWSLPPPSPRRHLCCLLPAPLRFCSFFRSRTLEIGHSTPLSILDKDWFVSLLQKTYPLISHQYAAETRRRLRSRSRWL